MEHEEHHDHKEEKSEEDKIEEYWDDEAVMDELGEWLGQPSEQSKFEHKMWTMIHIMLSVATAGVWLLGLFAYWGYEFKQHLEAQPRSFKKKVKITPVEEE